MRAVVYERYGSPDVLQCKEVETPVPKDNEILIKVHASEVTAGDCELRSFNIPLWYWLPLRIYMGLGKPRNPTILGMYLSGEIASVGTQVKSFKKGDHVFGCSGLRFGTDAEYICLPEDGAIAIKPVDSTYQEAAAVPIGGLNALHFLEKGNVGRGEKVLIIGGAGSIGTFAIQIAKLFGAEVVAVDSTEKLEAMRTIGADRVIDYTREDCLIRGETYDVIFDVVGKSPFSRIVRSLKKNGRYLLGNPGLVQMIRGIWTSAISTKKVIFEFTDEKAEGLNRLKELVEAGKIKPVIDRCYPLEQLAGAHRYVESGAKKGSVVVVLEQSDS